jgi:lipoprotein-releasing system ATP-binding protein
MSKLLVVDNLHKDYSDAERSLTILKNLNCSLVAGESVAIMGRSGSGKTTLLNLLGGLDVPTAGTVKLKGTDLHALGEAKQCFFRNQHLGFIYQFHHLLPEFTALENVSMPLLIGKVPAKVARLRATAILKQVGLQDRINHEPSMLSGGERQRVAIARALVHEPLLILADEPTGNLDNENAEHVLALLLQMTKQMGRAVIVVTHDMGLAAQLDRTLILKDGQLVLLAA